MKTKLCILMLCLLGILYLQFGRAPYVNMAITKGTTDGYVLHLTITANKLFIPNKEAYAEFLIQKVLDNNFKNMLFSYDELGYPERIFLTIYTNNVTWFFNIPAFNTHYSICIDFFNNREDRPIFWTVFLSDQRNSEIFSILKTLYLISLQAPETWLLSQMQFA